MNDKKNNVLKIGLIVLIILNIILLSRMYFFDHHPSHHKKHERPDEFVIRELKLNEEQINQYNLLVKQHRDSIQELFEEGKKLRNNYFSQLKSDTIQEILINDVLIKIKTNQQQIEEITFNHFFALKQILNKEQKNKFDNIINEVVLKLSSQNRRPE